jgi:hypothetical protein
MGPEAIAMGLEAVAKGPGAIAKGLRALDDGLSALQQSSLTQHRARRKRSDGWSASAST